MMIKEVGSEQAELEELITPESPLGPSATEGLLNASAEVFTELYDVTNHTHRSTRAGAHSYIVGRKGAGKTAFLVGAAFTGGADVVLIRSEHIYAEVNKLRSRYSAANGPLVADTLVHVWEVLLFHAAMLEIARSDRLPNSQARRQVFSYIQAFGDPRDTEVDQLLARVSAHMTKALLDASADKSFREACWSLEPEGRLLSEAVEDTKAVLRAAGTDALYVVVDNLEDLHNHLDDFAEVIRALFRVTSRQGRRDATMPFQCRFAFPAELLPRLRILAANPEKDFLDYRVIKWTAAELIVVVGNRLRIFLDLCFPNAPAKLGLPKRRDPRDREAAERTLRAVLPDELRNGFGGTEDPVAYLLRHTQLLPRHLIQMLNEIMVRAVAHSSRDDVPGATAANVLAGVKHAEQRIVAGILTTYSDEYPLAEAALKAFRNRPSTVEPVSELHRMFNQAGVHTRVGIGFEEFLDAMLAIGALGVVRDKDPTARYVRGEFSYTFTQDVSVVEDTNEVCVHPLFMYRMFDRHRIDQLKGTRAVYPYGSDLDDDDHDI